MTIRLKMPGGPATFPREPAAPDPAILSVDSYRESSTDLELSHFFIYYEEFVFYSPISDLLDLSFPSSSSQDLLPLG